MKESVRKILKQEIYELESKVKCVAKDREHQEEFLVKCEHNVERLLTSLDDINETLRECPGNTLRVVLDKHIMMLKDKLIKAEHELRVCRNRISDYIKIRDRALKEVVDLKEALKVK